MSTHRLKIDVPENSYGLLRHSGQYASETDAITSGIPQLPRQPLGRRQSGAFDEWMRKEILTADDECELHPEQCLTSEQLRANLLRARQANETT